MDTVKTILLILEMIVSVALTVTVLLQSGKEAGLGAISGETQSYMGQGKSKSLDKIMASATKWIAVVWLVLTVALCMM